MTRSSPPYLKRCITNSGSTSMFVSTMFGAEKKHFSIWHFCPSRSPENKFSRHWKVNMMTILFLCEPFLFREKVPSPLGHDHVDFF